MNKISNFLLDLIVSIRTSHLRTKIPKSVRALGYNFLPKKALEQKMAKREYKKKLSKVEAIPLRTVVKLAIIKDDLYKYGNYEAACRELGISYVLIDIYRPDWIRDVASLDCDAFLVWPSCVDNINKQLFDERLKVISKDMGKFIFPSYDALWLYESKRRTADWLMVNNIAHPQTWVFFNKKKAIDFLETTSFPIVFKTDLGATASGVEIVENKRQALRLINLCFGKGYLRKRSISGDRDYGYIFFQEYIPDLKEWRIVRVGSSFFGHQKVKKGKFHSGSKLVSWDVPNFKLLDFSREVTEKGKFFSMNLDIFETKDGCYLVNELQAMFGSVNTHQMMVDNKPARYVYDKKNNSWMLEEGQYCQNLMCNLRVEEVLKLLCSTLEINLEITS